MYFGLHLARPQGAKPLKPISGEMKVKIEVVHRVVFQNLRLVCTFAKLTTRIESWNRTVKNKKNKCIFRKLGCYSFISKKKIVFPLQNKCVFSNRKRNLKNFP